MPLRLCVVLLLLVPGLASSPSHAAPATPDLSQQRQVVRWSGTLDRPGIPSCGEPQAQGCDTTALTVVAAQGAWITVAVDGTYAFLRVADGEHTVASNGTQIGTRGGPNEITSTTFQHVRAGRVRYEVGISHFLANPYQPLTYRATARLAGKAFDREGDCFVGDSGLAALTTPDDGRALRLSVRLLAPPRDVAEVRQQVVPSLVEMFGRINVVVRASVAALPDATYRAHPYEAAQRLYGGVRPPGVDVVFLFEDRFSGGIADCIGGVAYAERAFASGQLHYAPTGVTPVSTVKGTIIAAHEIGHLLGGQHQMSNCAEALPQLALQPASDGSVGPCTVMGPAAVQDSETFSTAERASIRSYVRRFARG